MDITYFVHSITEDNEKGLATGWLSGKLSSEGIDRAKKLSNELSDRNFDAVFSSDLARAIDSTHLFFKDHFPVYIDWRLRECNYGSKDGLPAADFKKNREQDYIDVNYPDGESYLDVEKRMRSFIRDLQNTFDYESIAIVGHQAPQLALDVIIQKMTWTQAIKNDWRKKGAWQPGWEYCLD